MRSRTSTFLLQLVARGLSVVQIHAQDGLVYRDPDTFQIKPLPAVSWKPLDDTTIDFELRKDATFHNGDKFSADDVVYTINGLLADKDLAVLGNYLFPRRR